MPEHACSRFHSTGGGPEQSCPGVNMPGPGWTHAAPSQRKVAASGSLKGKAKPFLQELTRTSEEEEEGTCLPPSSQLILTAFVFKQVALTKKERHRGKGKGGRRPVHLAGVCSPTPMLTSPPVGRVWGGDPVWPREWDWSPCEKRPRALRRFLCEAPAQSEPLQALNFWPPQP